MHGPANGICYMLPLSLLAPSPSLGPEAPEAYTSRNASWAPEASPALCHMGLPVLELDSCDSNIAHNVTVACFIKSNGDTLS